MFTIYIYVLDTLADWELAYITSELNSGRFFKKNQERLIIKKVSYSYETISTMGGIKIKPDCLVDDIIKEESSVLLLPGAQTWSNPEHKPIIEKAKELLSIGSLVCAICGATVELANNGILDKKFHTSNGVGFLEMFSPDYKGKSFYVDKPSVVDGNLITANCTGSLMWTKQIIEYLDVFNSNTLEFWYKYFDTGNSEHFFALMESL